MAANIYPDAATSTLLGTPAQTPVDVVNGASMTAFAPLAANVGPDPAHFNLLTSFIRISMSGAASATPPQVELKAVNPSHATEGPPVIITGTSIGTANALNDGFNATDAASAYFEGPHPNNVYRLKVIISISGTTLKLRITNNTGANRDFVWAIGDSEANSQQPWIHLTPDDLSFVALVNQTSPQTAQSLTINNRGTGAVTVNGVTPTISAPYTIAGLPTTPVDPNPAAPVTATIGFNAPATIGEIPLATFTVDSTDANAVAGAGHNKQFTLTATAHQVEVALALDDSGSMSWAPDGTDPPPQGVSSRWSELQSAAKLFVEVLGGFAEGKGTFSMVKFPGRPDRPVDDLTSYDFDPAATAKPIPSAASMAATKAQIDATTPFYKGTPMYYGLDRLLTAIPPYFATDANSMSLNSRWLLLLSDGAWNSSPDPRGKLPALVAAKIKVFGAGYGTAGEVDFPTLVALSTGPGSTPGGQALQVDAGVGYTATALANAFKAAIKAGLTSIGSALDPTNILHAGAAEALHQVIITPYDTRVVFLIDWNTPDADRMTLQLLTPTCELLTPGDVLNGKAPGVTFTNDLRHQMYVIDGAYLHNTTDPARPRFGVWELIVSSPQLTVTDNDQDEEQYAYDVLLESALQMAVTLDRERYYAGDSIKISAKLTVSGRPITAAAVTLEVTVPGQAMANWLAAVPVSIEEYEEAAEALADKDASAVFVKAYAATQKGFVFQNPVNTITIPMFDLDNHGEYTATFGQTATPDAYTLLVSAVGTTDEGVFFRRERTIQVWVGVRPDPLFTLVDFLYEPVLEDRRSLTASVRVTPLDRFGNVVLLDPATSSEMVLRVEGAEMIEGLTTQFDGIYSARLDHSADRIPVISLEVGGEEIIKGRSVPPVGHLRYSDSVLNYRPGLEAEAGANQHSHPQDALGDVLKKSREIYVALGAYGELVVGVEGESILARGDDDITVFVQPAADLRPYLLEALSLDGRNDWVELGRSAGVTQSFGLQQSGLKGARAVRITDLSGRTRDSEFMADSAPGVSVRGVGFARVGTVRGGPLGCLLWPIELLRRLWDRIARGGKTDRVHG